MRRSPREGVLLPCEIGHSVVFIFLEYTRGDLIIPGGYAIGVDRLFALFGENIQTSVGLNPPLFLLAITMRRVRGSIFFSDSMV